MSQSRILNFHRFSLLIGVAFATTIAYVSSTILPYQIGVLIDTLNISEQQGGFLGTIELTAMACVMFFISPFIAKISCYKLGLSACAIVIFSNLACTWITDIDILYIYRALAGAGYGLAYSAANAAASASDDPDKVFAISVGVNLVFMSLLLLAIPYAGNAFGKQGVYLSLVIFILICVPFMKLLGPATEDVIKAIPLHNNKVSTLASTLTVFFLFSFGTGALWSFAERVGNNLDIDYDRLGLYFSSASFLSVFGSIAAVYIHTRVPRVVSLISGLILLGTISTIFTHTNTEWVFAICTVLFWMAYIFVYPFLFGLLAEIDPQGHLASTAGGVIMLAYAIGTGTAGMIATHFSYQEIGWAAAFCCVTAILFITQLERSLQMTKNTI